MTEKQIFGLLFAALISVLSFAGVNLTGAALVSDGGTIGAVLMPLMMFVWFWSLYRLWRFTFRKLFPTTKDPQ